MNPEALLKKYASDKKSFQIVLAHSKKVAKIAARIANRVKVPVDKGFIHDAAMLHDIGRFICPPWRNSVFHGIEGARIMRKEGFPEIARVCERHLGAGIPKELAVGLGLPKKDYLPETPEEKIICYADRLVDEDREIPFERELERFKRDYDKKSVERLLKLHREIMSWIG